MHPIGIRLAKLGEPVGNVFVVRAKAENVVFAVSLDVDVPHIGVVDVQAAFFHACDTGDGMAAHQRVAVVAKNLVAANIKPLVAPHFGAADGAQSFAVVLHAGHAADLAGDDEKKIRKLPAQTKMPTMVSNIITSINKNICYWGRFSLYFAPLVSGCLNRIRQPENAILIVNPCRQKDHHGSNHPHPRRN